MPLPRKTHGPSARREEGAAMLVVMLVLLMVSATAAYAVHATGTELRAAGQQRLGMETHYSAQAALVAGLDWVDRVGPQAVIHLSTMRSSTPTGVLDLAQYNEPPLSNAYNPGNTTGAAGMGAVTYTGMRLYVEDLSVTSGSSSTSTTVRPITGPATATATDQTNVRPTPSAHTPQVVVDVYDIYRMPGSSQPGQLANGYGTMMMMRATYTARARARIGDPSSGATPTAVQTLHEVASDARSDAISGPFGL